MCRQSLVTASDVMKLKTSPVDSFLFLVRHLLILKELVYKLDLEHRETEKVAGVTGKTAPSLRVPDVTPYIDALASMLSKTTSLFPNALFTTLGIPRAEDSIQGAKSVRKRQECFNT